MPDRGAFERVGYGVVDHLLSSSEAKELCGHLDGMAPEAGAERHGGIRSLLEKSSCLRSWAESGPPAVLARSLIGPAARPVKATLFDETPGANWKVPWQQDLTTRRRRTERCEGCRSHRFERLTDARAAALRAGWAGVASTAGLRWFSGRCHSDSPAISGMIM